jgi:alpha-tubulin suppressor-like RCC1 family protein
MPMRTATNRVVHAATLLMLAVGVSCSSSTPSDTTDPNGTANKPVDQLRINPSELRLNAGDTASFSLQVLTAQGQLLTDRTVAWSSSNTAIATVAGGRVAAVSGGTATITAVSEGKSVTGTVIVAIVPIASVTVTPPSATISVGQSVTLTAAAFSSSNVPLAGRVFTWTASPTTVATVSNAGVVTGVGAGTVNILVASEGRSANATITVNNVAAVFASISAGTFQTCGLTPAGKAYCWGNPQFGALGTGDQLAADTPRPVAGNLTFSSISSGGSHTCALTPAGVAWCWGTNTYGALGDGTRTQRFAPVQVINAPAFTSISAGGDAAVEHTCALTSTGAAYCWGVGSSIGDGAFVDRLTPSPVAGGIVFSSISAGENHACGLDMNGKAFCWGTAGSLGDGSQVNRNVPGPLAGNLTFKSLVASGRGGCGITTGDAPMCWGNATTPGVTNAALPWNVGDGRTYTQLAPDQRFTCGLVTGGAAYCWGLNDFGQLGDGTVVTRSTSQLVNGGLSFVSITTGGWHACGRTATGATYCWGYNAHGEVGTGVETQGSNWTPKPVKSP